MKNTVKIVALVLALYMTVLVFAGCTKEKEEPKATGPVAFVTVFDGQNQVAVNVPVEKSDEDSDGKWTINDALISLHNAKCADGYKAEDGGYGLMITKLWGVENGGAYGYYKNNVMCMGLTEELSETESDHIYAYVYSDAAGFSDVYTFFDKAEVSGSKGDKITLTLSYVSFDESYNQVNVPLADAVIKVNGEKTELKTGEDGKVEIEFPGSGSVISAEKDGMVIIPPVCSVSK
ncbi:MAG: hypothetical protein J5879_07040 [Clostridia bacterium]|nr:hypothetical protein [Clostridia bacterium]